MRIIKFAAAPLFMLIAMFCVYGALASTEPSATSDQHTGWLLFYGVTGTGALLIAAWLLVSGFRQGGKITADWEG